MRYKSWLFYNDWWEIFGKDRATGGGAKDFIEAVNHVLNINGDKEDEIFEHFDKIFDGFEDEKETMYVC